MRLGSNHVQAELTRKAIVLDRVSPMRHCVDNRRDVAALGNKHNGVAFPTERAACDLFQGSGICLRCRFHIHVVGAALALDAEGKASVDVIQ